jgi:glycerol-3-phosphate dehydrogenase
LGVKGQDYMKRQFDGLSKERFDLIVIGGGVIGTGVARDAAMRGVRTLLVEKEDFGYGTTSRSTRLIHGGLRYLSHFDFKLVRQDLREREILLRIAPHLVKPLAFLLPLTSISQHFVMGAGMRLYDALSRGKSVPSYHHFSRRRTLEMEPQLELEGLQGAYQFYDAQASLPERLCMDNAISAASAGAVIVNHAEVTTIVRSGDAVDRIRLKDGLSRATCEVQTRAVVNVTGHWANAVMRMVIPNPRDEIRTTLGVHLVTPKISNNAMVLFAKADGRLIFVIPWQGYSLIGTTDTPYSGDREYIAAEAEHVRYLLAEVQHAFPHLRAEDVFYAFAGLRSLVGSNGQKVSNISRSHKLVDHQEIDGVTGFFSILGGKMTGYRSIAEEAVDLICRKLGVTAACKTAETPLPGAPGFDADALALMGTENGLSLDIMEHLNASYGSRLGEVLLLANADAHGKDRVCPHSPDIVAEIWHAVNEENCLTVSDYLLRRGTTGLASCQGLDAVEVVAVEMGRMLGWSIGEWQQQTEAYRSFVAAATQFKRVLFAKT